MKKISIALLGALTIGSLGSCLKNDVDPVTDKNSTIKIETIKLNNYTALGSVSRVRGIAKFEFEVQNTDTPGAPLDIVKFADTFDITNIQGYTQHYDFDTPEKTKTFKFNFAIFLNNAVAQSGSVDALTYKRNGNTLLQTSLNVNGSDSSFAAPTQTVNF